LIGKALGCDTSDPSGPSLAAGQPGDDRLLDLLRDNKRPGELLQECELVLVLLEAQEMANLLLPPAAPTLSTPAPPSYPSDTTNHLASAEPDFAGLGTYVAGVQRANGASKKVLFSFSFSFSF
jgi:hypothetical protein